MGLTRKNISPYFLKTLIIVPSSMVAAQKWVVAKTEKTINKKNF